MRNYGRDRRAPDAHAERENEQRIEHDVRHRADNDRHHCRARKPLRGNETVKSHGQQREHAADNIDRHIIVRVSDRLGTRAERKQKPALENKKTCGEYRGNRDEHDETVEKYFLAGLAIPLAHFHRQQRRTAQSHEITERSDERDYRTANADACQRKISVGHFAYKNPVDYAVQHVHELREHRRDHKPQYQRKHFIVAEVVGSFHTLFVRFVRFYIPGGNVAKAFCRITRSHLYDTALRKKTQRN